MAVEIKEFTSISAQGDIDRGGWTASLVISDPAEVRDYLSVAIYVQECWGESLVSDPNFLIMAGRVVPQALTVDWEKERLGAIVVTSHDLLNLCEIQPVGYAQHPTPTHAHQLTTLSIPHIVKHMLEGHTNFVYNASSNPDGWVTLNGIDLTAGDSTFTRFSVRRGYIWPIIQKLASDEAKVAYFDRSDDLYYDYHPMFKSPLPSKVVTLDASMWISITPVPRQGKTAQIRARGEQDDGTIVEAVYPPVAKGYGRVTPVNVRCNDPATLAAIAEYEYRWQTRPYDLVVKMKACRLGLGDRVGITFSGIAHTGEKIDWHDEDFYVQSVSYAFDLANGKRLTELRLTMAN